MANWKLTINITKEIKDLKELTENLNEDCELIDETGDKFVGLAQKLEAKVKSHEADIKRITEDDGTFEDLERELEDFVMSYDLDSANYTLENIYSICDVAGIWLEQLV